MDEFEWCVEWLRDIGEEVSVSFQGEIQFMRPTWMVEMMVADWRLG